MKLYLDDERKAPEGWAQVKTAHGAIALLCSNYIALDITHLSLDHDLGDDKRFGTGYDVLLMIEKWVYTLDHYFLPEIKIHTANVSARVKMEAALKKIKEAYDD